MNIEQYLTPALVVGGVGFLWQVLGKRLDRIDKRIDDIRQDIARTNERLDRHLEKPHIHPVSGAAPPEDSG